MLFPALKWAQNESLIKEIDLHFYFIYKEDSFLCYIYSR